jgi:hypothetical protein
MRREPDSIAAAIGRLAGDPSLAAAIAAAGAARIREQFTNTHTACRYAELIAAAVSAER